MNKISKELTKEEQNVIVPKIHTGGLPLNMGYSIGVKVKNKQFPDGKTYSTEKIVKAKKK